MLVVVVVVVVVRGGNGRSGSASLTEIAGDNKIQKPPVGRLFKEGVVVVVVVVVVGSSSRICTCSSESQK